MRTAFPLISLALLWGCNGSPAPTDPDGSITLDVEIPRAWTELAEEEPDGDEDGDGLSNAEELEGYDITVNTTGWPGEVVTLRVFSDPTLEDADGDGLTDASERTNRTHPLFSDTDGDGLSDSEEVLFWGTSATSVDSDGDAVGLDGFVRPPNPALFDGAELQLDRSFTAVNDVAVPGRPGPFATSPRLTDTDGDTVDDYEETLLSGRSPVIAEVVDIQLLPTPSSSVEIGLTGTTTDGTSTTETFSDTMTFDEGISTTLSTEMTTVLTTTVDTWFYGDVDASVGCCADILSEEAEYGFGVETSVNLDQGFSMSFDADATFGFQNSAAEASTQAASNAVALDGGVMRLSIDLSNTGAIATRVTDIALIARILDPETGALRVLGELVPSDTQSEVVLSPGETTTIQVENLDLPLEPTQALLADPRSLSLHIARYDLRNADGEDFDFLYADLPSRTSSVAVERQGEIDRFYIASDVFTDVDGNRYGIRLADALEARGTAFTLETNADGDLAVTIDGIGTQLHTTEPPDLTADGADAFGYPYSGGPGDRFLRRGWVGLRVTMDDDERDTYYTDFFQARLAPGDGITLLLSEDLDQDGVPAIEEALHGSSDLTVHSDAQPGQPIGDGLSDFWEIREGWEVSTTELLPYRAWSSPGLLDTDGDGLSDLDENSFDGTGTDPTLADTDGDGYPDFAEVTDLSGVHDPLEPTPYTPPALACTYEQTDTCDRVFHLSVTDDAGDVDTLWLVPGDGTPALPLELSSTPGESLTVALEHPHCFSGHPSLDGGELTASDSMGSSSITACVRVTP